MVFLVNYAVFVRLRASRLHQDFFNMICGLPNIELMIGATLANM